MPDTNEEIQISITDILHSIWDIRIVVLLLTIFGGIIGGALSTVNQPTYETKASMIVTAQNKERLYQDGETVPGREDISLAQDLAKSVQMIAVSDRVLGEVLDKKEYSEISVEELKQGIEVTAKEETAFLQLTLNWDDEEQAVELLNRMMEVIPDVMLEVMDIGSIHIVDRARQAIVISNPSYSYIGIGIIVGLTLGCVLGTIYYLFMPKIRNKNSLEILGLDVIGEIPLIPIKNKRETGYLDKGELLPQEYKEAYGRLTAVFHYITGKEKKKIIAVTSNIVGEGKTTIAYNLALQLTKLGCKVLLLDFDFDNNTLYKLARSQKPKDGDTRIEPRNGEHLRQLVEQMYNGIYTIQGFDAKDIFHRDKQIFPAIQALKDTFDYILIDTPPVGTSSDVQHMHGFVEGIVMVVRQGGVSVRLVEESVKFLEKAGITIVGGVLNYKEKVRHSNNKHRHTK